ncbi:zinc finger protein 668-like isoform X16 [Plodia interpunctella]|uniref:zinc finger protein 668-like isoform X16 n=1 Tax=Plodia interpunctella TaxID=58824 RepID=UPI002367976B|nr:zinc finger protein 668-like isoform X15 [Plodia interpunctella]
MAAKSSEWRPGPTVCRCCLTEGCYKDISTEYFWMGKREVYAEMLKETLEVTISYSKTGGPNSNSRLICEPCISRLRDATEFKRQVVECERVFMQHLDPGSTSLDIEVDSEPMEKIKIEGVKLEKSHSDDEEFGDRHFGDDDDDDDDDLDNQPLTKLASRVPKKESVDLLDLLDTSKPAQKRKSTVKVKPPPSKKAKTKIEAAKAKPSSSKAKPEKKKKGSAIADAKDNIGPVKRGRKLKEVVSARQMRRRRRANNELPEESDKRIAKTMMRRNAMTILEGSYAWAFRWFHGTFYCSYCDQRFPDIDPLRHHVKHHLKQLPTKMIFSKLRENNMLKIDITDLVCRICHCDIDNIDHLKDHLVSCHGKMFYTGYSDGVVPFKLDNNGFQCQKCYMKFDRFPKLNEHINSHYQNYVCPECGKVFMSKSRYRRHVQSHETGAFACGECSEIFQTRAARFGHRMKVHNKGIRYSCPRCPETFTHYHSRLKHLFDKHGQRMLEYHCPACSKTFDSASKRAQHYKLAHTNIDKKFECQQCDEHFVSNSKLQKHAESHFGN